MNNKFILQQHLFYLLSFIFISCLTFQSVGQDADTEIRSGAVILPDNMMELSKIQLNVFEQTFTANWRFTDNHKTGAQCWVGNILDSEHGYMIVSQYEDFIWGKIDLGHGIMYQFTSRNNSKTAQLKEFEIEHTDEECMHFNTEVTEDYEDEEKRPPTKAPNVCSGTICSDVVIDVMVFFSPAAATNMGGITASKAACAAAVSEMNLINSNSNVTHSFSLVRNRQVTYTESGSFGTDLSRFRNDNDGYIDGIHNQRDNFYGDIMALVLGSGGCGLGNVGLLADQFTAEAGFSVVSNSCMTGNKSLAHEIGHNMGFRHDRYAYTNGGGSLPDVVCPYGWGWVNPDAQTGGSSEEWRTVMAYNKRCIDWGVSCTRIPYWSNPMVNYNGNPTGSPIGNPDAAHNRRIIMRSSCHVQEFREKYDCNDCLIYRKCTDYNANTGSGPGNTTVTTISGPFAAANPAGVDVQVCVYYNGDHDSSSEQFDVLDENSNILGSTVITNFDCRIPNRVCFDVSPSTYNSWISNNSITVTLDPKSTGIDPNKCNTNNACCEIIVKDTTSSSCSTTVTNASNSGPGSLRDAIVCANSGDSIYFSPSLDGQIIETELPVINIDKLLYFEVPNSYDITLSNKHLGNTDVLISISDEVYISGLKIIGKSENSMIMKILPGGNLIYNEGDIQKVDIRK